MIATFVIYCDLSERPTNRIRLKNYNSELRTDAKFEGLSFEVSSKACTPHRVSPNSHALV